MRLLLQLSLVIAFCLRFSPSPAASPEVDFERALINSLTSPQTCEPMSISSPVIEEMASPSLITLQKANPTTEPHRIADQFDLQPEAFLEADVFSPEDGKFDQQAYRRSLSDNYRRIGGAFELFDTSSAVQVRTPEPSQIRQYLLQYRTARSSYPIDLDKQVSVQAQDDPHHEGSLASSGPWLLGKTGTDAYTAALMIHAPGAHHLSVTLGGLGDLPAGTTAHVYGVDRQAIEFTEYFVSELNAWITPPVRGEKVLLHLTIPADGATSHPVNLSLLKLDYGVDRREILGIDSGDTGPGGEPAAASSPCFDNACFHSGECYGTSDFPQIEALRKATALIATKGCTGTLVTVSGAGGLDPIPYLITANHCISSQSDASSQWYYFDYRMSSCTGECPSWWDFPFTFGADLVYTSEAQDVTLLRLHASPPPGRYYMGWSSAPIHNEDGFVLHRLHHSLGQAQHYSRSIVNSSWFGTCSINFPAGNWIRTSTVEGLTEGTASGSAIVDSQGRIRGQLWGICGSGALNCPNYEGRRIDGAFAAYFQDIRYWLAPPILQISPSSTSVSSSSGSTSTTIFNPGADTLQWTASSGCGWATPPNSSGNIAANSSALISISYQANSGSSQRQCSIEFTGQDGTLHGSTLLLHKFRTLRRSKSITVGI